MMDRIMLLLSEILIGLIGALIGLLITWSAFFSLFVFFAIFSIIKIAEGAIIWEDYGGFYG